MCMYTLITSPLNSYMMLGAELGVDFAVSINILRKFTCFEIYKVNSDFNFFYGTPIELLYYN